MIWQEYVFLAGSTLQVVLLVPMARRFDPDWARSIVAQCREGGVACFIKQLGGSRPGNKLEDLPEDLRVREWPR